MNDAKVFILIGLTILLFGCGGGGSGSSATEESNTSYEAVQGVWNGIYTKSSSLQFQSLALITSDGQVGIELGNGTYFTGVKLDSTSNLIAGYESTATSEITSLGTTVTPSQSLSILVLNSAYLLGAGDSINSVYNIAYDKSSSMQKLAGTWSGALDNSTGVPLNVTIRIAQDGTISGTSSTGFTLTGNISAISSKNEYSATLTINNPGANYTINGMYDGIATLLDSTAVDDTLIVFLLGTQQYKTIGKMKLQRN